MVFALEMAAQQLGADANANAFLDTGSAVVFHYKTRAGDDQLWRTDGTAANTRALTAFPSGVPFSNPFPHQGKTMFFAQAMDTLLLYETNGTDASPRASLPSPLGNVAYAQSMGSWILYLSQVGYNRVDLWRTDGTTAGTTLLTTFNISFLPAVYAAGSRAFLAVPISGCKLWATDGTVATTAEVMNMSSCYAAPFGNSAITTSSNTTWAVDGAPGTARQIWNGMANASLASGSTLYFGTMTGDLVKTDGTAAGTTLIKSLGGQVGFIQSMGANRMLVATYHTTYTRFWTTDGTAANTVLVAERPSVSGSNLAVTIGGVVYFAMTDSVNGNELWRTDGTDAGTVRVTDIPNYQTNITLWTTAFSNKMIFTANDGLHGKEPWISDGTAAGTSLIANLEREATLRGKVTDAVTGAPLTNTKVTIGGNAKQYDVAADGTYVIEGLAPGVSYAFLQTTSTDSHVDQAWKGYECVAGCPSALHVTLWDATTFDGYDFKLRQGGKLKGRVTDGAGHASPGAVVRLVSVPASSWWALFKTTDADGNYAFDLLAPGTYQFYVDHTNDYPGTYTTPLPQLTLASGEDKTLDLVARKYGIVRGHITSTRAGITPSGYLSFYTDAGPYTTSTPAPGAEWEQKLPDGRYYVGFSANSYSEPDTWYSTSGCRPCTRAQATPIDVTLGNTTSNIDIVILYNRGTIKGRVTDFLTGQPVVNLRVNLYGTEITDTTTDASGNYQMEVTPGTYYLYTEQRDPYLSELYDGVRARPCQSCDPATGAPVNVALDAVVTGIDFSLAGFGTITGRVTDAVSGVPIALRQVKIADATGLVVGTTNTDSGGNYTLNARADLPLYVFTPSASGYLGEVYNDWPCENCNVTTGNAVVIPQTGTIGNINFTLDKLGTLTGTVVNNANSQGLANVSITLTAAGLPTRFGGTTSSGSFTISNMQAGTYTLTAEATGYATVTQTVTIAKNQTTNVTVRMNMTGQAGGAEQGIVLTGPTLTKAKP
jgi:ELWxxDGT repeat protein